MLKVAGAVIGIDSNGYAYISQDSKRNDVHQMSYICTCTCKYVTYHSLFISNSTIITHMHKKVVLHVGRST